MTTTGDRYLASAIETASPARIRLMLIERACEISDGVADDWAEGENLGVNERTVRLLEILTELLEGVRAGVGQAQNDLCIRIADLYVFLIQHLVRAELRKCPTSMREIHRVLETELETWRLICAQETGGAAAPTPTAESPRLNLRG